MVHRSEGRITGFYINRATGFHCIGSPYPVTGWVLDGTNTITFTVKWENTRHLSAASQKARGTSNVIAWRQG
jgi:hypothetical protein